MRFRIFVLVAALGAGATAPVAAQQRVYHGRQRGTVAELPHFEDTVRVDGSLDEPVWRSAALGKEVRS